MKCITVCQPYASAFFMALSHRKRVENRDWPSAYRGPLLIHAGKSKEYMDDDWDTADEEDFDPLFLPLRGKALPFGQIIGMVEMVGCMNFAAYESLHPKDPWAFGPWCHVYENPELFKYPIPYRGLLGIYNVPDELLKRNIA